MSAAVMMEPFAVSSPLRKARSAGFFWLMTFLAGAFAMMSLDGLAVSGDPAATAANILLHEPSLRLGVVADLLAGVSYVIATLLVYDLLKAVNRNLSLLAAFFSLLGCAVGAI